MKALCLLLLVLPFQFEIQEFESAVNNEFALHPFQQGRKDIDIEKQLNFNGGVRTISTRLNKHSSTIDSVIDIRSQKSEFIFIKTKDKKFFSSATITDSAFVLNLGVRIGLSRTEVLRKFKIKSSFSGQSLIVTDSQAEYTRHVLYFENGKLVKIFLNMNFD